MKPQKNKKKSKTENGMASAISDNQRDNKVFSLEELKDKPRIVRNKKIFFMTFLQLHQEDSIISKYKDNLIGLAESIYQMDLLYIKVKNGYKRMAMSSIITDIHLYHKEVSEKIEKELQEKKTTKKVIGDRGRKNNCSIKTKYISLH